MTMYLTVSFRTSSFEMGFRQRNVTQRGQIEIQTTPVGFSAQALDTELSRSAR